MMKQYEIFEAARKQMIERLGLTEMPYQVGTTEYGEYITVTDGEHTYDVPVTVTVAAHKFAPTEKTAAYDLAEAAEEYQFELDERAKKAKAKAEEKARKEKEKAEAKAKREAEKAARKAKAEEKAEG